jgi:hypothetical protein
MNEQLYEMIFKRKSFHLFLNVGNEKITKEELNDIDNFFQHLEPLYSNIKVKMKIVKESETTCHRKAEYCLLFYSENKDGYLQNIGYIGEQIDLYLVSKNIGTLWFGIGKVKEKEVDGLEYVVMIAIHKISDQSKYRKDMYKSKRKDLEKIWTGQLIEGVSDVARFAPSACNSQPWLVKNGETLDVYRYKEEGKRGIMPTNAVSFYNRIDIGIFMCFLELCLAKQEIRFTRELYSDNGLPNELTLNSKYKIYSN